ncbi:MAG: TonB-dependent receptor [Bacteroidota bacterium]
MYKNYFAIVIFFSGVMVTLGQSPLSGKVLDDTGIPMMGATVQLQGTKLGVVADENGYFKFEKTPYGNFKLVVSSLGFQTKTVAVQLKRSHPVSLTITLAESSEQLDEVVVRGKSQEQQKRERPIKIEVIDIAKVVQQATSLPEIINQISGVKVRQSSGVGSNTTIAINGLQGNAIRFFKDGIPTDYLGRSFDLSLLPTGNLKNVEIYKGVLPIALGADALGGAVNLTTKEKSRDYRSASYEIGSFNTNILNLGVNYVIPKTKLHAGVTSYYTYTDNDYEFTSDDITDAFGVPITEELTRFHDAFRARYVDVNFGVHDTKWADILDISLSYFDLNNQVQNGISIVQPLGEVTQAEITRLASFRYAKQITPKWNVNLFLAYSRNDTQEQDLAEFRYNWFGEQTVETPSGEVQLRDQRIEQDNHVARFVARYDLNERFNIKLSSTYNSVDRVGTDPFAQENFITGIQPITIPSTYRKIVSGLGIGSKFFGQKLVGETFVKNYYLETESASFFGESLTEELFDRSFGFGQSFKYEFDETTYVRISYEQATRIPEADEYFGDNLFLLPNPLLIPETSDNLNVGIATNLNKSNSVAVEINGFYRDTKDFIRIFPQGLLFSINRNSFTQIAKGVEMNFRINPSESSSISAAITYQDLRGKDNLDNPNLEDSRTPNIPYFFTNLSANKNFLFPFGWDLDLNFYGNYLFTEQYFVRATEKSLEPGLFEKAPSSVTNIIPSQHQVNMGVTCKLKKIPLSLNFEVINALDAELYDEFRIPKPLRNFRLKMTYRL